MRRRGEVDGPNWGHGVASDKRKMVIEVEPLLPESLIISGVSSVFGWGILPLSFLSSSLSVLFLFFFFSSFFSFFSFPSLVAFFPTLVKPAGMIP